MEAIAVPAARHERIKYRLLNGVAATIAAERMGANSPMYSIAVEGRFRSLGCVGGPGSRRRARRTIPGVIAAMGCGGGRLMEGVGGLVGQKVASGSTILEIVGLFV